MNTVVHIHSLNTAPFSEQLAPPAHSYLVRCGSLIVAHFRGDT